MGLNLGEHDRSHFGEVAEGEIYLQFAFLTNSLFRGYYQNPRYCILRGLITLVQQICHLSIYHQKGNLIGFYLYTPMVFHSVISSNP